MTLKQLFVWLCHIEVDVADPKIDVCSIATIDLENVGDDLYILSYCVLNVGVDLSIYLSIFSPSVLY